MAFTRRARREAYDNISVGNATGKENTILGNAGSTEVPCKELFSVAGNATTDKAFNRIVTSAGGVTTLEPRENPAI